MAKTKKKIPYTYREMNWWQKIVAVLYTIYFHLMKFFWTFWSGYLLAVTSILSFVFPRKIRKMIQYFFGSLWCRGIVYLGFLKVHKDVSPNVDFKKTYLFVGNHSSSLDIYISQTVIKSFVSWVAKRSLFDVPFLGTAMWTLGHIPSYRNEDVASAMTTVKKTVSSLKRGNSICIFPEGTRSYDGKLLPFKKGAGLISRMAEVEIVPIIVHNVWYVAPKGSLMMNPFVPITIKVLDPISSADKNVLELTYKKMQETLDSI